MNKRIWIGISSFYFLFSVLNSVFAGQSPKDVMVENEDRRKIEDVYAQSVLTTGGGNSTERVKRFTWWRKLTDDQVHFSTLTRFHLPAEIRGEGILFLEHKNNENEVLMYLPNFKKIRRVESQQQSGSFMGSEFSYSDIATPHVEDYQYKMIREEKCPGTENAGISCYVIESLPVSDAVKERTGYSKAVNWIRHDNKMGVHGEYYNLDGELFKKSDASEIKQVDSKKNKWMAHQVRIENVKTGKYTQLQFTQVKVNQGMPNSLFTQQNLSRTQ